MQRWATMRTGTVFVLVLALYVAGSAVAWWMIRTSDLGAVFFPPAGVTLIAFLSLPRSRWSAIIAAIIAGEFAAGYTVGGADDALATLGFGVANAAEPLVATIVIAALLHRPKGAKLRLDLANSRELAILGLGGLAIGPLVGATIGSLTAWWRFDIAPVDLAPQWWLGDALAVAIISPLCLVWQASGGQRSFKPKTAAVVALSAASAAAIVIQVTDLPLLFLVLIGLVVVGALLDVRIVAVTALAVAFVAGGFLVLDPDGLIGGLDASTALWVTKVELLFFIVVAYAVAAEAHQRMNASIRSLRQAATVSELQRLLLPPSALSGPDFHAVGVYDAAQRDVGVGGDWYYVRQVSDGKVVIGVGDIVGHDIDAARTMASVRSGLLLEASLDPTPHRLLARLDRYAAVEPSIRHGTAWLAVFDPATSTLDYSCAGHIPPLLVHDDEVQHLDEANTALVGLAQGPRVSATIAVPPGATLVTFTDGLVERRNDSIDAGVDRLIGALRGRHLDPRSVADELLVNSPRDDDTILVMVQLGQPTTVRDPGGSSAESAAKPDVPIACTDG